jgi:hypothetical protein
MNLVPQFDARSSPHATVIFSVPYARNKVFSVKEIFMNYLSGLFS